MTFITKFFDRARFHGRALLASGKTLNEIKMISAKSLLNNRRTSGQKFASISEAEFKVFSQFGEDGIIQHLVDVTKITAAERSFVEFGAEVYAEANTRFLVQNDNWRGLLMECFAKNVSKIKKIPWFWMYNITVVESYVTPDNINELLETSGFTGDIGLLSIDIDGIDYWVWRALTIARPVIVVCEYNSVFGSERAFTVPYDPSFYRINAHHSGLYFGASLKALTLLAEEKGYALVGSNSAGNNAFFVRRDRLNGLQPLTAAEAYVESQFRESMDAQGNLTFLAGKARRRHIGHMRIFDVERQEEVLLGAE